MKGYFEGDGTVLDREGRFLGETGGLSAIRSAMMPHYDIHPEMVTHTRVIDLKTGQPYPDHSLAFRENWEIACGKGDAPMLGKWSKGMRLPPRSTGKPGTISTTVLNCYTMTPLAE